MAVQSNVIAAGHSGNASQIGYYELVRPIGSGGMGTVYEAYHRHLKKKVALKVLSLDWRGDGDSVQRFYREMEAIGQLKHPNIVEAYDAGCVDGVYFIAMELVDGSNVEQVARRRGKLDVPDACEIVRQAALGTQHAHECDLIHRDIKPGNLLLDTSGRVKLSDLGLARLNYDAEHTLTGAFAIIGTVAYMAPEQASDEGSVDARTDVYSLGCTLYRLLAGSPPFAGPKYETIAQKLRGHAQDRPSSLMQFRDDVPGPLHALVGSMLEKRPSDRPASAQEVADRLLDFSAESVSVHGLHLSEDTGGPADPHKTTVPNIEPAETVARRGGGIRQWARAGVLTACLIAAVAFGLVLADRSSSSSSSTATLGWQTLPSHEPEEIIWPRDPGLSTWHYDAVLGQLRVDSQSAGMLGVGTLNDANAIVRADLYQLHWRGDIGIFYGLPEDFREAAGPVKFEMIHLQRHSHDNANEFPMSLQRIVVTMRRGDAGEFRRAFAVIASSKIAKLKSVPHTLELQFAGGGLSRVRWNGEFLPELCPPRGNDEPAGTGCRGILGTWSATNSSMFENMEFRQY